MAKEPKQFETGLVVSGHGRSFIVETTEGARLNCSVRGKKTDLVCGDRVRIQRLNAEQAVIDRVEPRATLLYRADDWRSKLIAANVTQAVIVLAAVPSFSEELLNRCLLACEAGKIKPLILMNKSDLPEAAAARLVLQPYLDLGYPLLELSAKQDVAPLRPWLEGETTVLVGQSGMGKSTIINGLLPDAGIRTNDISVALDTGKHTTTNAALYHLDARSCIIDSPGMQEFGLKQLSADSLDYLFREFRPFIGKCRFANCRHLQEPGCAVLAAVQQGAIQSRRIAVYQRIRQELSRQP